MTDHNDEGLDPKTEAPEINKDGTPRKPMGGARAGAGRPKGARSLRPSRVEIDAHGSIKKLEQLGFDPIEAHIKAIEEIDIRLNKEDQKKKPSSMAISQLLSIKEKHVSSLMRYGYRQVPEKQEVEQKVQAFGITLTDAPKKEEPMPAKDDTNNDDDAPSVH